MCGGVVRPQFMAALLGRSLDDLKRRPLAAHEFKELKRALNGVVVRGLGCDVG